MLKRNYADNNNEIKVIEDTLNSIMEERIRDKAQNYLKDELLNDEKMTPKFLNLAKSINCDSLSVV